MLVQELWHQQDRLVDVICHTRQYGGDSNAFVAQYALGLGSLIRGRGHAGDFLAFRDAEYPPSDYNTFKTAWIAQRVLQSHAKCVGIRPIQRKGTRYESVLLHQLALAGFEVQDVDLERIAQRWDRSKRPSQSRIDAICFNSSENQVSIVKSISFSSASSVVGGLLVQQAAPLFATEGLLLSGVKVPAEHINAVVRARELVTQAVPGVEVRCYVVVIDDSFSWNFQMYEVPANEEISDGQVVALEDSQFVESTLGYKYLLRADHDYMCRLPCRGELRGFSNVLEMLPWDRCVRSAMYASVLFDAQHEYATSLVKIPAPELENLVSGRYRIAFTRDVRRHDLEDGLRAGGLARRSRLSSNAYCLTSAGLARLWALTRKYNPMVPVSASFIIEESFRQMKLWLDDSGYMAG